MRAIFQKKDKKEQKNVKKGQNIWKFGQQCTKFENILKKGSSFNWDFSTRWRDCYQQCNSNRVMLGFSLKARLKHVAHSHWTDDGEDNELFWGEWLTRICSRKRCQRSWPSQISDTLRSGFEPVKKLSSGFVKRSYVVVITTTPFLPAICFFLQQTFVGNNNLCRNIWPNQ